MPFSPIVSSSKPICLVGGAPIRHGALKELTKDVDLFVAADGGADRCFAEGIAPALVTGDMDSISCQARQAFATVLEPTPDQSATDFEKALSFLSAPAILAVGFTGARIDHSLSALNVMARHPSTPILLLDDHDASFVLRAGDCSIDLLQDSRISIMPIGAARVTASGVRWPFDEKMSLSGFVSPSNAALGGPVRVTTDGPVLLTVPRAQWLGLLKAAVPEE